MKNNNQDIKNCLLDVQTKMKKTSNLFSDKLIGIENELNGVKSCMNDLK